MMEDQIRQVLTLMRIRRYKDAQTILTALLEQEPLNTRILYIFAEVKLQLKEHAAALEMIRQAIGLSPSDDRLWYRRGRIRLAMEQLKEAEEDFLEALRINPHSADYFASLAVLRSTGDNTEAKMEDCLQLADKALALNPENVPALNARYRALSRLGRTSEAERDIRAAFSIAPDNPFNHATLGWMQVENGQPENAVSSFAEALRLDPLNPYAQLGLREAMKGQHWLYRQTMGLISGPVHSMTEKIQTVVQIVLTAIIAVCFLSYFYPPFIPYALPIGFTFFAGLFLPFYIVPLSNLILRLNKTGRHLLSRRDIVISNRVGSSLLAAIAGLTYYLATGEPGALAVYMTCILLMVPLSVTLPVGKSNVYTNLLLPASVTLGIFAVAAVFDSGSFWHPLTILFFAWFFLYLAILKKR
jgi:tetratricopeptide (TPR) repeat protein